MPLIEQQMSPEEFKAALAALPEVTPETEYSWPQGGDHLYAVLSGPSYHSNACIAFDEGRR